MKDQVYCSICGAANEVVYEDNTPAHQVFETLKDFEVAVYNCWKCGYCGLKKRRRKYESVLH